MFAFRCLRVVKSLDSVSVPLGASLLEEFRIHGVALVRLSLDRRFEVFLGRLDDRSLDLCLGRAAHLLDHGGVVGGVNFLSLGCSAEQTRNFAISFLVGFFCEREVARMGIAFAVEPSLQVVECFRRGGSPVWQGNQGERESERTVSELLHTQYSPFQFQLMATCIEIARLREGHGVGQASTCAKLHRTNSESHVRFQPQSTHVRRIGQGSSEPSDITGRLASVWSFIQAWRPSWRTTAVRLRMAPIEFVVCQLALLSVDGIPRVKTCNSSLLRSFSALNLHPIVLDGQVARSTRARPAGLFPHLRGWDAFRLMAW